MMQRLDKTFKPKLDEQKKSFKYIRDNQNPEANMLIAISNGTNNEKPDYNKWFKIINKETGEEILPCKRITSIEDYPYSPNVLQDDVYHYNEENHKWRRVDALEYPTKKWTWEYLEN